MSFLDRVRARARTAPRRIGFPEADEERTATAVRRLQHEGLVRPVVVGPRERFTELLAREPDLEHMDPEAPELGAAIPPEAEGSPVRVAAALLAAGRLDGVVAGARASTAEVARAGLNEVGLAPGIETLSSSFYMSGMARDPSQAGVLTFTDAAVVPDPGAEQLAEIAEAATRARRDVVGDDPRVAFLSYSTRGSAGGASVEKVRAALERFRGRLAGVPADGEMQLDTAVVPEVAARKAPDSEVAGRANVLVFPDLDAGNIGYKLVERLAGAHATGPIFQGLAYPLNDLSRGADAEDIVHVACITALSAG